jgi:hypothetical protein
MWSTEDLSDFWEIFLNGFHVGRNGKILPALKKFPTRKKKKMKWLATWVNSTWLIYPIFCFPLKITK